MERSGRLEWLELGHGVQRRYLKRERVVKVLERRRVVSRVADFTYLLFQFYIFKYQRLYLINHIQLFIWLHVVLDGSYVQGEIFYRYFVWIALIPNIRFLFAAIWFFCWRISLHDFFFAFFNQKYFCFANPQLILLWAICQKVLIEIFAAPLLRLLPFGSNLLMLLWRIFLLSRHRWSALLLRRMVFKVSCGNFGSLYEYWGIRKHRWHVVVFVGANMWYGRSLPRRLLCPAFCFKYRPKKFLGFTAFLWLKVGFCIEHDSAGLGRCWRLRLHSCWSGLGLTIAPHQLINVVNAILWAHIRIKAPFFTLGFGQADPRFLCCRYFWRGPPPVQNRDLSLRWHVVGGHVFVSVWGECTTQNFGALIFWRLRHIGILYIFGWTTLLILQILLSIIFLRFQWTCLLLGSRFVGDTRIKRNPRLRRWQLIPSINRIWFAAFWFIIRSIRATFVVAVVEGLGY